MKKKIAVYIPLTPMPIGDGEPMPGINAVVMDEKDYSYRHGHETTEEYSRIKR